MAGKGAPNPRSPRDQAKALSTLHKTTTAHLRIAEETHPQDRWSIPGWPAAEHKKSSKKIRRVGRGWTAHTVAIPFAPPEAAGFSSGFLSDLSADERRYFDLLSHYVEALPKTVAVLIGRQRLLNEEVEDAGRTR